MIVRFANINMKEPPVLILKNANETPLAVMGFAYNVALDLKYNEVSTLEFELPAYADGVYVPYYDLACGMNIVEVQGVGQFTLENPSETGDGVRRVKTCKANSLEYELTYKKVSIPEGTYKFFGSGEDTILGMIMEALPSWRVGSVPQSIANKYRTFDQTNENVYNFMKGEVQESFNCIFDFDTMTRMVYVRDINEEPAEKAVFISTDNLAKEIELEENTEDIVTRLDVNGAEGVDIRDVNPTGTNKLICLDYFMTRENFDQALIDKYFAWKALCDKNRRTYYDLSVRYGLNTMRSATEQAKLADLQGELTGIENEQAVTIQAISLGLETQAALDEVNARIRSKKAEIAAKQAEIDAIAAESTEALGQLKAITETCAFERYFTGPELLQMDRYIKDGELSESSFVAPTATTYNNSGDGSKIANGVIGIRGAEITETADTLGNVRHTWRKHRRWR